MAHLSFQVDDQRYHTRTGQTSNSLHYFIHNPLGEWSTQQIHSGGGEGLGIYRIAGQALDNDAPLQWSLILKVLGRSDANLDASGWGYWRREVDAYQSGLLNDLPADLHVPLCFGATEPTDGIVWLWLEDIQQGQETWTLSDYQRVARQLGQFNGYYLNQQSLPTYPWLSRNWLRSWVEVNADAVTQLRQSLDERWVQRLWHRSVAEALLRMWDERDLYLHALEQLPQTLCHLDIFRRNLMRGASKSDGSRETVVLDWAFVGSAALGEELVPLTLANISFFEFNVFAGRELEEHVLTDYLDGLRDSGWSGDPQLVRLGYASAAALRYGVGVLRVFMPGFLNEALHPNYEQVFGHPIYELYEGWGIVTSRFTLRLADEARDLMDKLGYR